MASARAGVEIPNGFIFHLRDIHDGEVPRARQAGQLHGIAAVGFDTIAGFLRMSEGATTQQSEPFFIRDR